MRKSWIKLLFMAVLVIKFAISAMAATTTWTGTTDSDWFTAGNWDSGVPGGGDDAVINAGADVLLTNATAQLSSLTMSGGTLTCSNWMTRIWATNISIEAGTLTLPEAFTNGGISNRIWIVCSNNFTLAAGAVIDVNIKGFAAGNGPGVGSVPTYPMWWGGAHGGKGGAGRTVGSQNGCPGSAYGVKNAPLAPGSGGYPAQDAPGAGGGAVRIEVGNTVTINGSILADGCSGGVGHTHYAEGGGSGGSIYISCGTFDGSTNGFISANGGDGGCYDTGNHYSGGGAGGRIAVTYTNISGSPAVRFAASHGISPADSPNPTECYKHGDHLDGWMNSAGNGTLYLSDASFLSTTLSGNLFKDVELFIPGFTSWSPASLTVSNCSVTFAERGFDLSVGGDVHIGTNGELGVRGNLSIGSGGNLTLTNGGILSLYAEPTNTSTSSGALLDVAGDINIAASSWIYPYSEPTNGGSVLLRTSNLTIASGGGINASGKGYFDDHGPGTVSTSTGGAGYGGKGGQGQYSAGGQVYGSTNAPVFPGSGGADGSSSERYGGMGGGLVRVEATGNISIDGTIEANGAWGSRLYGGGGSGGGIFLWCAGAFQGSSNGVLRADGGEGGQWNATDHRSGGGGGGRIAVWPGFSANARDRIIAEEDLGQTTTNTYAAFQGTISVTNGIGRCDDADTNAVPPDPGTVVFMLYTDSPIGTTIILK